MTYRTKRLLHARWQRLRRWEFWPVWAVYPPVLLPWAFHAVRLRGATLWAGCNPAMQASGMAMEEKGGILDSFRGEEGRIRVAGYLRIQAGSDDPLERLTRFLAGRSLDYPVVLKPDLGQRGQGVAIVRGEAEARRWISSCEDGIIVQEYVGGLELGVQSLSIGGRDWCGLACEGRCVARVRRFDRSHSPAPEKKRP